MAVIESIGFAPWVQPVNLRFASVSRLTPRRVAHPPPWSLPTEFVCLIASALNCIEETGLDTPD